MQTIFPYGTDICSIPCFRWINEYFPVYFWPRLLCPIQSMYSGKTPNMTLQFLEIFTGPAGKNEKRVTGSCNAWQRLMPRHSDVEMRIYILFKCRIVLSTGCFLPLRYPQRFKLDGKTAIGNEAPERQRAIFLSILTG